MVNVANARTLIASLKGEVEHTKHVGFNMNAYISHTEACGLADMSGRGNYHIACLAGHAYLLMTYSDPDFAAETDPDAIECVAALYLALDYDGQQKDLFWDLPAGTELSDVTVDDAIATLERLIATGKVEWRLAANDNAEPKRIAA